MKVVVVGGSGFIGSRLVGELVGRGHDVSIFDKNPSRFFPDRVVLGDVRDENAVAAALKGAEAVVNLAAEHRDDVKPVSLYYDVNVGGARNIAKAASANGIHRIVFTSSVAVYPLGKPNPDETSTVAPFNDYGKSKYEAEGVLRAWAAESEANSLTVVRPVVIFGEGNRGNVYNLIKQVQSGRFLMVGSGQNKKSMAYVGNVVEFLVQALSLPAGQHLFNFADKPDMPVAQLIALIESKLTGPRRRVSLPYPVGLAGGYAFDLLSSVTGKRFPVSSIRIRKFCADTTVAADGIAKLGFSSPFTLEEGLSRMVARLDESVYFEGGG